MYERMLDKQNEPSFEDLTQYSGVCGELWLDLDKYLVESCSAEKKIRFPYGNKYGWGVKYSLKSRHICDIFAENNAFMILMQMKSDSIEQILDGLSDYSKKIWNDKYPCGSGGWLNYRVLSGEHLGDVKKIIDAKVKK